MDPEKVSAIVSAVRRGENATIIKDYTEEAFKSVRLEVLNLLEHSTTSADELRGILKGLRMIDSQIQSDINQGKQAKRKVER